jgi:hypothetical protein
MRLLFFLLILVIAGCNTNVDVQGVLELTEGEYSYCEAFSNESVLTRYSFYYPHVTKYITQFEGPECEGTNIQSEQLEHEYEFNSKTMVLTETKRRQKITFFKQSLVNDMNRESFCGWNDWTPGRTRITTDIECRGQTFHANEVKTYQIQLTNDSLIVDGITFYKF